MKLKSMNLDNLFVHAVASDVDTCYVIVDNNKTAAHAWKLVLERTDGYDDAFDVAAYVNTYIADDMKGYALANPEEDVDEFASFVEDTLMDGDTHLCDCPCTLVCI